MAELTERRTLPTPDRDSAPYWAALADGVFLLQHCLDCAALDLARPSDLFGLSR